jgi:hypothetical protein
VTTDANALLMGSKTPAAKFEAIGASITGVVAKDPEVGQQTDFRTKVPLTWKDGSPKMQIIVTLKTQLRDPQDPDDDGTRLLFVKGKNLTDAVRDAVTAAGARGIYTGGTLAVTYIADGVAEGNLNPPKIYSASYTPPATSFAGVAAPAAQPTVATSVLGTPAAAIPPAPVGVDAATWAAMAPEQRQRVLAALAPTAGVVPPF